MFITDDVVESYEKCRLDHDHDQNFSLEATIACHSEVKKLVWQNVLDELEEAYEAGSMDCRPRCAACPARGRKP